MIIINFFKDLVFYILYKFKENNFEDNIISLAQRGDIVFFKERTDCNIEFGGAFGIFVGSRSILKCKEKLVNVDTMQGDISRRL